MRRWWWLPSASLLLVLTAAATVQAAALRTTLRLDGAWQAAEGSLETMPTSFAHTAPVPGLADMATPAFEKVGARDDDPRRQAFWFRRTFTIEGPVPAVALLKVRKASFGTRVYLNGQLVGDHVGCFTPGYFDLSKGLQGNGQTNTLVLRIGAAHTAVGEDVPWGYDGEKSRYVPGIYDSVELILCGSPALVRTQTVPDLPGKRVGVVTVVRNPHASGAAVPATLRYTVREAKTQKIVGRAESAPVTLAPGAEATVEASVPLEGCRLWSPEDPFLYELEISSGGDALTTRFGMRSFAFDPQTKRAMLNGKPYFLRGTNICIFRFFEDALRGDKPWREDWVRNVIRGFRGMHWNSARYCIGFPPEMWYRIADEEGFLIQDEFPVWGQTGTLEALTGQYTEWIEERWNHPSVVIWDAQNETAKQDVTDRALTAVRGLDRSGRPWDNGWAEPQSPTDVYESHPYRHIMRGFRMETFATMSPKPGDAGSGSGNVTANRFDGPILINEYGWLWLNRDGTPTTLSIAQDSYRFLTPPNPTPEDYREAYARALAAKTEFWRTGRKVAGVLHFCGLGYARPDGQTSDNYIELEGPTFEPHFFRYVRDAFAPVGLMVDFWREDCLVGETRPVSVVVINDLETPWHGPVTLRLLRDGQTLATQTQDGQVEPWGRAVLPFSIAIPRELGRCELVAELSGADGQPVRSVRAFQVTTAEEHAARRGLTGGCPVTVSSALPDYAGKLAVDGDPATRWSSEFSDPQWLCIDLGKVTKISRVELEWEAAFGKSYAIQVSRDGQTWSDVYTTDAGHGGSEVLRFAPVEARWVRYHGTARGTQFGHSLWELRVFP